MAVGDPGPEVEGRDFGSPLPLCESCDNQFLKLPPQHITFSAACSFSQVLKETVRDMAPQCDVTFQPSEEGSGKGAALIAAVVQRKQEI